MTAPTLCTHALLTFAAMPAPLAATLQHRPDTPRVGRGLAALTLALLLGLQPITTDVYLPALPMLTRALGAPMSQVQLTMSALILAFGIAQMFWGPLADRIGRRPVLMAGLLLYTAASVGCALAGSIQALVLWRVCQGAAMAAAVVCARAIVRDLYEPAQGAQVMSLALSGLGVLALCSPVVGGATASLWGWRAPLAVVAGAGASALLFVALRWPETLRQPNPKGTHLAPLLRQWSAVGRHPVFVAWALLVACTYGGLFTILAASSFVYMDVLGLSAAQYGVALATGSVSYLCGTFVCRRWIRQLGLPRTVARGAFFTLAGGVGMAAAAAWGLHTPWAVLVPQCLFAVGHGIHQPCGQAAVVGPFPHAAGAASALSGLVLAVVAFGVGRWLGLVMDGTARPLAYGLCMWSLLTCAVAWGLVPRLPK
jgi:MFS transporter, DHA1 family, multidrug resistance protein